MTYADEMMTGNTDSITALTRFTGTALPACLRV
jgi:hypothetical protein